MADSKNQPNREDLGWELTANAIDVDVVDDKSESQVLYSAQDEIKHCFKPYSQEFVSFFLLQKWY